VWRKGISVSSLFHFFVVRVIGVVKLKGLAEVSRCVRRSEYGKTRRRIVRLTANRDVKRQTCKDLQKRLWCYGKEKFYQTTTWVTQFSPLKGRNTLINGWLEILICITSVNMGSVSQPPGRVPVPGIVALLTGTWNVFGNSKFIVNKLDWLNLVILK